MCSAVDMMEVTLLLAYSSLPVCPNKRPLLQAGLEDARGWCTAFAITVKAVLHPLAFSGVCLQQ